MGYSLSIATKSAKARREMIAFLDEHYHSFSEALTLDPASLAAVHAGSRLSASCYTDSLNDPTKYIRVGDALAYGSGPSKIGFNFRSARHYSQWMCGMCRFMALRVGYTRTFKKVLGGTKQYPYYTYDSDATPVLLEADVAGLHPSMQGDAGTYYVTAPNGHRLSPSYFKEGTKEYKKFYPRELAMAVFVEKELNRLSQLWAMAYPGE